MYDEEEAEDMIDELNAAHDAQNAVLARMQAELDALRAERDEWKRRVQMAQDDNKSFYEPQLDALRRKCDDMLVDRNRAISECIGSSAERDAAISQITFLNKTIEQLRRKQNEAKS